MDIKTQIYQHQGNITYDALTHFDFNLTTAEVIDELKEDLLQVSLPNSCLLDIGWYPEFDKQGHFCVQIVADYNWDEPIFTEKCTTFNSLNKTIITALSYIKSLYPKTDNI